MKNVLVANMRPDGRFSTAKVGTFVKAQIENSIEVGWEPEDILLLTNFEFEFMGVTAKVINYQDYCLTGSKMFALAQLEDWDDTLWAHDLDAWQNVWFDEPEMEDVGIATYVQISKYNGGNVFWKPSAKDIIKDIVDELATGKHLEEPTINTLLRSKKYSNRVTSLNNTFNVGCSGFVKRAEAAHKPIRVAHFNPQNETAWATHALDYNKVGIKSVGHRLENLLRKHYPNLETG